MKYLYKNKYWLVNKEYDIDKILYLMIDRPNEIYNVEFVWTNNKNKLHRDYDLPSMVYICDYDETYNVYWDKNGEQHRENTKPAIIYYDSYNGYKQYWTNGKLIKIED